VREIWRRSGGAADNTVLLVYLREHPEELRPNSRTLPGHPSSLSHFQTIANGSDVSSAFTLRNAYFTPGCPMTDQGNFVRAAAPKQQSRHGRPLE
jgi:hypothetical protein